MRSISGARIARGELSMKQRNSGVVTLRDVVDDDLPILFEQQLDADARYMAAFVPKGSTDRAGFMAHWAKNRANAENVNQIIEYDGQVAGYIAKYILFGEPTIGYWLGKPFWGKGIATTAAAQFVAMLPDRPLYARVAQDNIASRRVLEKCGFIITDEGSLFSDVRGAEVEEYVLILHTGAEESAVP